MSEPGIITGIDIGTNNIRTVITDVSEEGGPVFLGYGIAPASGLRRGVVINMEKTVQSISKSVEEAEIMASVHIESSVAGIAGDHIRSINSHGVIAVSRSDNEIGDRDVSKAIEAASAIAIPADREIVHVLPQEYTIDEQSGIKNPVGMTGVRLEVEVHIVTAAVTSAKNIYRSLERCEIDVEHLVLQSLASSYAVINDSEEEMGVVLIDIGGDLTDVAVFFDGSIRHTGVVPLGGKNVTNDIAIGLRTSVEQAEQLKKSYGSALTSLVDADEMMEVPGTMGRKARTLSCNVLASIIEPRMEEILSLAAREIKKANPPDALAAGAILTGGGAMLPGVVELAEQILDMPVKIGEPRGIDDLPTDMKTPDFATAVGLVNFGHKHGPGIEVKKGGLRGLFKKFENWISNNF
ncbi:MAG: cell division protein FtsA [Candidatus Zixiibacteriota bacterium]|nr:MAG: cell division protein FtsA [candidate division Zixibacteria bacterium]